MCGLPPLDDSALQYSIVATAYLGYSLAHTPARSSILLFLLYFYSDILSSIRRANYNDDHLFTDYTDHTHGQLARSHHHHPRPHLHRVTPHHHRMTGSMERRADNNSDNESDITELTDSVDLDQTEAPLNTTNPDTSIVLDPIPSHTAPVTQPSITSAQTTRRKGKQTATTSGPNTVPPPAASGSTQPRTRRSARISELASPDIDQVTSTSAPGSGSSTGATVGKGKKRAQAEETEAGPSKKQ